jgi:integrase
MLYTFGYTKRIRGRIVHMPRPAKIWFHKHKKFWCTKLGGKLQYLAKGRANKEAALAAFDKLKDEVELLGNGSHRALTVASLVESYLQFAAERRKPRTYEMHQWGLRRFVDEYAGLKAYAITPHHVGTWSSGLAQSGLSDTTVAMAIETVMACWGWAVRKGLLAGHQLKNVEKPKKRQRNRFVTDEEFQALLRATNARLVPRFKPARLKRPSKGAAFRQLLIAADQTAARPGELSALQWDQVDWERKIWILQDHKTRTTQKMPRPRIIPMTPVIEKLLRWRQKNCRPSPYCFTDSRGNPWNRNSLRCRMRSRPY